MSSSCVARCPYENYSIPCNSEHNKSLEFLLNFLMETDKYEKLLQKQMKQQMDKINKISQQKILLEKKNVQEMMDYYAIQNELIDIVSQKKHNKKQLNLLKNSI
jgi:hypothetical protein